MSDTHDRPLREGQRGDVLRVLVSWETAQDIAAVKAPGVQENATPLLTQKQAIALLEATLSRWGWCETVLPPPGRSLRCS